MAEVDLNKLPNWKNLTKEEKARLKNIVSTKVSDGKMSISQKELKKDNAQ